MGPELLAYPVHEQLDPTATLTDVDVEVLAVGEKLAQVAKPKAPTTAPLVEFYGLYEDSAAQFRSNRDANLCPFIKRF